MAHDTGLEVKTLETPTRADFSRLARADEQPCVSIYLPTHRAGAETLQDPIRLKNLLREVTEGLLAAGVGSAEAKVIVEPLIPLTDDSVFWQHQGNALAIFRNPGVTSLFRMDLPWPELAVVGESFHVKPLLAEIADQTRFYILALSQKQVRLFRATTNDIAEVAVPGFPANLPTITRRHARRGLQAHSTGPSQRGAHGLILHGNGRDGKDILPAYFGQIDQRLRAVLVEPGAPLILATVDYLYSIYRKVSSLPELAVSWVSGNPDALTPSELHARALPIAQAEFRKSRAQAVDRYFELCLTPSASNDLHEILSAAHSGRIRDLFVAVGVQIWGRFDERTYHTVVLENPEPVAQDLLNLAAVHTYATGGNVYAVPAEEVPGGGVVASVFRY